MTEIKEIELTFIEVSRADLDRIEMFSIKMAETCLYSEGDACECVIQFDHRGEYYCIAKIENGLAEAYAIGWRRCLNDECDAVLEAQPEATLH